MIYQYEDFINKLLSAGFSLGGKDEGIYALIPWSWNETAPYETQVAWHTGNKDLDPWEWRIRVLDERDDIAYGKVFLKKSGYITKEWYPYFLAARRGKENFDTAYKNGKISHTAKRIYELIAQYGILPVHGLKALGNFKKEEKSLFDRGLTELQMGLFITMCGKQQKLSIQGEEYGWASTVFSKVEDFWEEEIFLKGKEITKEEAEEKITQQVLFLNPGATEKKIKKFIYG